jgi:hypothetical protein
MAIDLLNTLQNLEGDFRGAVLMTYTLDLNFFEQLVAPKLTALGCGNVLIITDPYGYQEALERGARNLSGVGKRYVCAPLRGIGRGIQHVKFLLLVGPQQGCLLLGSGNLTMPGYGRNLEQFTRFDCAPGPAELPTAAMYPFQGIWQLLRQLQQRDQLSSAALERLATLADVAPWLNRATSPPDHLQLWHSLDRPLFSQLPPLGPLDELQLISPFFDLDTIGALVKQFHPQRLVIGVDEVNPHLEGAALAERCRTWGCGLVINTLKGRDAICRPLHAKTVIGLQGDEAWYISGSANITGPAWRSAWSGGGNLELIVWQRTADRTLSDQIWNDDQIVVQSRSVDDVQPLPDEPPDQPGLNDQPLRLLELSARANQLTGQFDWREAHRVPGDQDGVSRWAIELLRQRGRLIDFQPDSHGRLTVSLTDSLLQSEAGRIVAYRNGQAMYSSFHWIDQLDELARYGHRSYHAQVKQQLETFSGAGRLFEDLLNFLWERVDPQAIQQEQAEQDGSPQNQRGGRQSQQDDKHDEMLIPPVEKFITDEGLVEKIGWHVEGYLPHDRSTMSLRDLLSLVLLRLTAETSLPATDAGDAARDEEADVNKTIEQEVRRREVLEHLRLYLLHYCQRYARRMLDPEFVKKVGPDLLFQNHFTLSRVLLEFADKAGEYFTQNDLRQAVVHILGALFWPKAAGLDGPAAWQSFLQAGFNEATLRQRWSAVDMLALTATLVAEAWGHPPRWTTALHNQELVQPYLLVQALLQRIEASTGQHHQHISETRFEVHDLWGYRQLDLTEGDGVLAALFDEVNRKLDKLAGYKTPVEEKYADLFAWWQLWQRQGPSVEAAELASRVQIAGFATEMQLLEPLADEGQLATVKGDSELCPECFTYLPGQMVRRLRSGYLVVCPNCHQTVLYWQPVLEI